MHPHHACLSSARSASGVCIVSISATIAVRAAPTLEVPANFICDVLSIATEASLSIVGVLASITVGAAASLHEVSTHSLFWKLALSFALAFPTHVVHKHRRGSRLV